MSQQSFPSGRKSETYTGHDVIDPDGNNLGQVTDVIYDDDRVEPTWLVVKPGALRAEHYAPVEGSYTTDEGNLVVRFDKQWLKSAPKATRDHIVDHTVHEALVEHYGEPAT